MGFMTVMSLSLNAQQQSDQQPGSKPHSGVNQEGNTPQNAGQDAQQSSADTPGSKEAARQANSNNQGDQNASDERASNTPAVPQTTTSQSGSPAVLSKDNGEGRDGTNNVQRASGNMAGSPANNLNLDEIKTEDADSEMKDRQGYTQDKQNSADRQNAEQAGNKTGGASNEINEKSRRENNALSDQNLSARDKKKSKDQKADKSDRKSKRKKKKG